MKKKIVSIIVIVIMIVIFAIGVGIFLNKKDTPEEEIIESSPIKELEDGTKLNTRTKLNEAKSVNGLLVSNIQLTEKDGMTTLLANVTNKTETRTEFKRLKIIFLDENGNEISSATAFLNPLEAGETTQLNASATSNYINAYDFKVVEN